MATIYCPKCGASIDSSSTFCGNCGYAPQASGAGTFYPPQGQQKGANQPPPPPPFPAGNMPSAPTYPTGNMPSSPAYPPGSTPSSPTYPTGNMPSSPTYSAGNTPPSPTFPTGNMSAPPTYPMGSGSTPSSPAYPTSTIPSSTYAGGGTNLPPPQPRRRNKGIIAIIAVVVVVILVAAGLVGFLEYKSHNTPGVVSNPTATPAPTTGATTTPGSTATTSTTATPGATTTPPPTTTANYAAPQPGPGCDTGGGTWTPQEVGNISCGTTVVPTAVGTWGYLYLQLPSNAAFSANNKITVSGGPNNGECLGLAEQDANTGFLVSYCDNGKWSIVSISNKGTIIRTLSSNFTSTRTTTTISFALVNNTLSFTIDTESHQITVSPLQPVKVAIAYYNSGCGNCGISTNNFSYITPAS